MWNGVMEAAIGIILDFLMRGAKVYFSAKVEDLRSITTYIIKVTRKKYFA